MATGGGSARWSRPRWKKVADFAADAFRQRILEERLRPGERLGSQDEVIHEMGLSRASAREALLLLQYQGLVDTRPGPAGGGYVAEPRLEPVVEASVHYQQFHGVDGDAVRAARAVIEPPLAAAAATLSDRGTAAVFREHLAREAALLPDSLVSADAYLDQAQDFHALIAEIATPSPFSLFAAVLFQLSRPHRAGLIFEPSSLVANHRSHEKIAEAIVDGNTDLAVTRMRRHMRAVLSWVPTRNQEPKPPSPRRLFDR